MILTGPLSFILPSRMTTEVVENAFSVVRECCGDAFPSAIQAKSELKTFSLSAALDPPKGSSYANAGGWNAVTLLDLKKATPESDDHHLVVDWHWQPGIGETEAKDDYQTYGIYHMCGWSLGKVCNFTIFL